MNRYVEFGRQDATGRHDATDGSELVNFYSVRPIGDSQETGSVPHFLQSTPGFELWADMQGELLRDDPFVPADQPLDIHVLVGVDGVLRGSTLLALGANGIFMRFRLGDEVVRTQDPPYTLEARHIMPIPSDGGGSRADFSSPVPVAVGLTHALFVGPRSVVDYSFAEEEFAFAESPPLSDVRGVRTSVGEEREEWVDVAWLDGYFILLSRTGFIAHTGLNATNFHQSDFTYSDEHPDDGVALETFRGRLFVFGQSSIEIWENVGATDFAFRRVTYFAEEYGCASRRSVAKTQEAMFFLGSDHIVYAYDGSAVSRISSESVESAIVKGTPSEAFGWTYTEEGHRFYMLNVGGGETWCFDTATGLWHKRDTIEPSITSATNWLGRNLVSVKGKFRGARMGVYEMSLDHPMRSLDDAEGVPRRSAVSSQMWPQANSLIVNSLAARIRPNDPMASPGGSFDLSYKDADKTDFSSPRSRLISDRNLRWFGLGQIRDSRNFRLETEETLPLQVTGVTIVTDFEESP